MTTLGYIIIIAAAVPALLLCALVYIWVWRQPLSDDYEVDKLIAAADNAVADRPRVNPVDKHYLTRKLP